MADKKLSDFQDVTIAEVAKLVCLYLDENNAIKNGKVDFSTFDNSLVHKAGTETITGDKTFSGDSTFSGGATFNNDINANVTGSADSASKDGDGNVISTTYGKLAGANTWTAGNTFSGSVALGSAATVTAPSATDSSTKVVNSSWVANHRCKTAATTSSTASVNAPAYVVTNYKSGGSWYRVWSDGWIEQGGAITLNASAYYDITFKKAFADTNYFIGFSHKYVGTTNQAESYALKSSKSGFRLGNACGVSQDFVWFACGY